jgi:hypothetical protein
VGLRVVPATDIIRSVCAPETGFSVDNATLLQPIVLSGS